MIAVVWTDPDAEPAVVWFTAAAAGNARRRKRYEKMHKSSNLKSVFY